MLTHEKSDLPNTYLDSNVTSHTNSQCGRFSKRKSQNFYKDYKVSSGFFLFYWRLFYKIHMLILIISIQLERKRENREPLNSFGHFFFGLASVCWSSFQIWRSECAKVPGTNIGVQFSIPGTTEQGLDRGWLSRDTYWCKLEFTVLPNWLEMHQKLAHPRCEDL